MCLLPSTSTHAGATQCFGSFCFATRRPTKSESRSIMGGASTCSLLAWLRKYNAPATSRHFFLHQLPCNLLKTSMQILCFYSSLRASLSSKINTLVCMSLFCFLWLSRIFKIIESPSVSCMFMQHRLPISLSLTASVRSGCVHVACACLLSRLGRARHKDCASHSIILPKKSLPFFFYQIGLEPLHVCDLFSCFCISKATARIPMSLSLLSLPSPSC